jgi:hypothetical protein
MDAKTPALLGPWDLMVGDRFEELREEACRERLARGSRPVPSSPGYPTTRQRVVAWRVGVGTTGGKDE